MRKVDNRLMEFLLDRCNDVEYDMQNSPEIKSCKDSLEQLWTRMIDNPSSIPALKDDVQDIYDEMMTCYLYADLNMIISGSFMFEKEN